MLNFSCNFVKLKNNFGKKLDFKKSYIYGELLLLLA